MILPDSWYCRKNISAAGWLRTFLWENVEILPGMCYHGRAYNAPNRNGEIGKENPMNYRIEGGNLPAVVITLNPGKVCLQTMPASKLARVITPYIGSK